MVVWVLKARASIQDIDAISE